MAVQSIIDMLQNGPYAGSSVHVHMVGCVLLRQRPLAPHWHTGVWHAFPLHPSGQVQVPVALLHEPRPEQLLGHERSAQVGPYAGAWHAHVAGATHAPGPQPAGHRGVVHSAPLHPASHSHAPEMALHTP